MQKNTPKFSLYFLPFVGAFTYLLFDFLWVWLEGPILQLHISNYSVFTLILEVLITYSSAVVLLSIILFLILIPILRFFNLNRITFKNTLFIIAFTLLYKIYVVGFAHMTMKIYNYEIYESIEYYLVIVSRLNFIIMLIIPLTIFLHFFKSFLDYYEEPLPQGQKKWLLANLLSIAGFFSLTLWIIYTFFYSFRIMHFLYSYGGMGMVSFFFSTYIALAFMMFSKKIMLTDISTRTAFITGPILALFSLFLIIISANLIDGAGYGIYIIFPFLSVSVPIATIIFTIVIVNKMYARYK
ncbi:hypothetical protein [Ignatzschineria sp. LJL83]